MPIAGDATYWIRDAFRRVRCQNWVVSKTPPNPSRVNYITPETLVSLAEKSRCRGMSFSFNEPSTSLFEYSLDAMQIAKDKGLYNTYVTNLYSTPEALEMITKGGCDAFCVNVKGDNSAVRKYCGADVEKVWRNLRILKNFHKHVEIVTLIIPTVNDSEATLRSIASRIMGELGPDVPWHCTRYFAAFKSAEFALPDQTPISSMEKAREIGFDEGLKYVYLGNLPGNSGENTYCPACKSILIERLGFSTKYHHINRADNSCINCSYEINIVGQCL